MGQITTYGNPEKSEHDIRAEAERLLEFGPKAVHVPVVSEPTEEELVAKGADEARLAELVAEQKRGRSTSYGGLKMMFGPIWKDMERCLEAGKIAGRLGVSNPITTTMMNIGEGTGVPQDRRHLVDLVFDKAKRLYRGYGAIDKDLWESL